MTIAGLLPAIVIRRCVNDCRILSDLANFVSLILGFFVICRFLSVFKKADYRRAAAIMPSDLRLYTNRASTGSATWVDER